MHRRAFLPKVALVAVLLGVAPKIAFSYSTVDNWCGKYEMGFNVDAVSFSERGMGAAPLEREGRSAAMWVHSAQCLLHWS